MASVLLSLLVFLPARLRDVSSKAWGWAHDAIGERFDKLEGVQ